MINKPEDAEAEQLALLENSQELLQVVMMGIAMQYKALELQKNQLCGGAQTGPDPKSIQIAASLIVLCALLGFQNQAEETACRAALGGGTADWTEPNLNATVILVALLRLCRLTAAGGKQAEEAELLAEPVI